MKKTIEFKTPYIAPITTMSLDYIFPFSSIDSNLIGTPEERARTRQHQMNVHISFTLITCWGFSLEGLLNVGLRKGEIEKIIYEYVKRYLTDYRTNEIELPEILQMPMNTKNTEIPCPFDHTRIREPEGAILQIDTSALRDLAPATQRVLFLSSDPKNATRLRLDTEQREIAEKIKLSKNRNDIEFIPVVSLRVPDLSQALLDNDPTIVHFSGHGSSSGSICLEDAFGNAQSVKPEALAMLFSPFKDSIRCIILNACYSAAQATAIANEIEFVIGMDKPISDNAATAFSIGFYQAIGAGRSIEDSFRLGVAQIALQGISEQNIPQLIIKNGKN